MKISYILPTYNVEKYLYNSIGSLFNQGLDENDFEVIIILDGCVDNCAYIARQLQKYHKNIIIIEQQNKGVSAARNKGIQNAKGEYIAFVDPDDALISKSMPNIIAELDKKKADMFIGNVYNINSEDWIVFLKDIESRNMKLNHNESYITDGISYYKTAFHKIGGFCFTYVTRRELITQNNLAFPNGIIFTEDTLFTTNLILNAKKIISNSNYKFYAYRHYHGSTVSRVNQEKITSIFWVSNAIMELTLMHDKEIKKYIEMNSYFLYCLAIWFMSHYDNVYHEKNEIIRNLKKRPIFTVSLKSFFYSLIFRISPILLVTIKYKLSHKIYKQ